MVTPNSNRKHFSTIKNKEKKHHKKKKKKKSGKPERKKKKKWLMVWNLIGLSWNGIDLDV